MMRQAGSNTLFRLSKFCIVFIVVKLSRGYASSATDAFARSVQFLGTPGRDLKWSTINQQWNQPNHLREKSCGRRRSRRKSEQTWKARRRPSRFAPVRKDLKMKRETG